jgi:uncharacterized protein (TIGR03066 family)
MGRLGLIVTGCALFVLSGCSSNNTGKIVGKWEMVSGRPAGASEKWGFTSDRKVSVKMSIGARNNLLTGTYTLGSGDTVELHLDQEFGGSKHHAIAMHIQGKELTMSDPDGTKATFKKVK